MSKTKIDKPTIDIPVKLMGERKHSSSIKVILPQETIDKLKPYKLEIIKYFKSIDRELSTLFLSKDDVDIKSINIELTDHTSVKRAFEVINSII